MSRFLYVDYLNHRGERRWREIDLDAGVRYIFTLYPPGHPTQAWQPCLDVKLTDREDRRTLAFASCKAFSLLPMAAHAEARVKDDRPRTISIKDGKEEPRVTDAIVDAVRDDLRARSAVGIGKYGTTLAASDEPLRKRLRHAYEEVLDLANYLKWVDQKIVADEINKAAEPFQQLHDRIDELAKKVEAWWDNEVMLSELDHPADGSGMAMAREASPIDRQGVKLEPPLPTIARTDMSLRTLRAANVERQKFWDREGKLTGNLGLLYRATELAGEAGEACNKVKKWVRENLGIPGSRTDRKEIADEIADVVICCDLLATDLKFDLASAVRDKFNATSHENNLPVELRYANTVYVDGKEVA